MITRFFPTELDLELESLFLEVLHDPNARLLRGQRPRRARRWLVPTEPVGANAPSLTRAERHLLRRHREEVASILRQAYVELLLADPWARRRLSTYVGGGKRHELLERESVAGRLARAERCAGVSDPELRADCADARARIERITDDPRAVLDAAARLVAYPSTPVLFGLEAARSGDELTAEQLLAEAAGSSARELDAAAALSHLAASCFHRGAFHRSLALYGEVLELCEDYPSALLGHLLSSLQLGRTGEFETSTRRVAEYWESESPELAESTAMGIHSQRDSGDWDLTPPAVRLMRGRLDRVDPILEPLLAALSSEISS